VTYTAQWYTFYKTIIELPDFMKWNESDRRFEIYSTDPADLSNKRLTYKI